MLQQSGISCHQRRCSKSHDLPDWVVPGHNCKHDTQRLIKGPGARGVHFCWILKLLPCQKILGMISIEAHGIGGLMNFCSRLLDGLAMLLGLHLYDFGCCVRPAFTLGECSSPHLTASPSCLSDSMFDLFGGMSVNDHFSSFICRVHSYMRHGRPFLLRLGPPILS